VYKSVEKELAGEFRDLLRERRDVLRSQPDSDPLIWAIPGQLACAQRPLRDHPSYGGSARPLPPEAGPEVIRWVRRITDAGICSIICLMHPKELRYCNGLDGIPNGLLDLYRKSSLEFRHIQWTDPAHAKTPEERQRIRDQVHQIKHDAYGAFKELPKPVLLHCSAGIDRSAPVAAFIAVREQGQGAP